MEFPSKLVNASSSWPHTQEGLYPQSVKHHLHARTYYSSVLIITEAPPSRLTHTLAWHFKATMQGVEKLKMAPMSNTISTLRHFVYGSIDYYLQLTTPSKSGN